MMLNRRILATFGSELEPIQAPATGGANKDENTTNRTGGDLDQRSLDWIDLGRGLEGPSVDFGAPDQAHRSRGSSQGSISRRGATRDEDGSVESVKTLVGNPILAQAAAAAVRLWVYQSAVVDGKAVKSTTVVKLNFKAPETR